MATVLIATLVSDWYPLEFWKYIVLIPMFQLSWYDSDGSSFLVYDSLSDLSLDNLVLKISTLVFNVEGYGMIGTHKRLNINLSLTPLYIWLGLYLFKESPYYIQSGCGLSMLCNTPVQQLEFCDYMSQ